MSTTEEMLAAYGEAVFYTHLVEDMLKLHIFDCAFYKRNCMAYVPLEKIRRAQFEDLIDMLRLTEPGDEEMKTFVERLHVLRRIRNILVHGFVTQIHKELQREEALDQITAMLQRFISHARTMKRKLTEDAFASQRESLKRDPFLAVDHPGYPGRSLKALSQLPNSKSLSLFWMKTENQSALSVIHATPA